MKSNTAIQSNNQLTIYIISNTFIIRLHIWSLWNSSTVWQSIKVASPLVSKRLFSLLSQGICE